MNRLRLSTLSLTLAIAVMTLGYATPSFAAKPACGPDDPPHPSCGDDGADGAMFMVSILDNSDVVFGLAGGSGSNPWLQNVVGKNSIGLNDASGSDVGTLTGVASFTATVFMGREFYCFPADFMHGDPDVDSLHQAIIKQGKKGRAEASFWFHGETDTMDTSSVRVLYVLKLIGTFASPMDWPSPQVLTMTEWELKVENEGKAIKSISCIDQGTDKDVTITVTLET